MRPKEQSRALHPEDTVEDLRTTLEELRVADDELRQQNEELAAAHLQVEIERQRYQDLFELAPDAYLITDLHGIIKEANQSASRLLRLPHGALPGRALASQVANEDRPRFRTLLNQPHSARPRTTPSRLQLHGRGVIDAELTYSTAHGMDGNPTAIRWLIRDVSEQQRMARQISALNLDLEQKVADRTADLRAEQRLTQDLLTREQAARHAAEASEAQSLHVQKLESIGVLAGGIAHDFNNLLHVVLGNADIALGHLPPGTPAREAVEEVIRATLRAADLTRQLLAYSGKGAFVITDLDLSKEVREMATLLRTAISKQATLQWELSRDLPAVSADPTQVRQIVMNLITNASEALGEKGGTITLRTGLVRSDELSQDHFDPPHRGEDLGEPVPGNYVYLEIADSGAGMTAETLSRIFDPFFSTKFAGRGLGLAAVMGIVGAHHGLIRIKTEPGVGTSFRVLFPPVMETARSQEDAPAERGSWHGSGTVLVVDDEPGVREVVQRMLEDIGFGTVAATDGQEAVDIVESGTKIAGVLLDLSMPNMDGEEAFLRLRALGPDLPIIMMSGYSEQAVAQQLAESSSVNTGFLQKPFLAEDLASTFRRFAEIQT